MKKQDTPPKWLHDALEKQALVSASRGPLPASSEPRPGELRVVTPGRTGIGSNRMTLVLAVDESRKTARVALVSNEIEYACDRDVILTRDETGLPYELMVECDIFASVWWTQTVKPIRTVPDEVLSSILSAVSGDFSTIAIGRRGSPIRGQEDPRWIHRESELDAMTALASECMTRIVDGSLLHPSITEALRTTDVLALQTFVLALSEINEAISLPSSVFDLLLDSISKLDDETACTLVKLLNRLQDAEGLSVDPDGDTQWEVFGATAEAPLQRLDRALSAALTERAYAGAEYVHVFVPPNFFPLRENFCVARSSAGNTLSLLTTELI